MKSRPETFSVLIAGVGGQGVVLMSRILARAAQGSYPFVCRTESRGLSQRGGVISSEVRMGERSLTPMVGTGREDLLLTTDAIEALRHRRFVMTQGKIVANDDCIIPLHMTREDGDARTPEVQQKLKDKILQTLLADQRAQMLSATELVKSAEGGRMLNMVMLGAASVFLPLDFADIQCAVDEESRPATALANRLAVLLGREAMQNRLHTSQRHRESVALG
jgi:indolepyruvate ferredoxin oxidoreductase, beta subunit